MVSSTAQKLRSDVLDGYKNDCISEYGFHKEGGDLLAACIQSKDQNSKTSESFEDILAKVSYTLNLRLLIRLLNY